MQLLGGCIRRRCGRSWHQLEVVLSVPAHFLRTAALMDAVRDVYARATAHARAPVTTWMFEDWFGSETVWRDMPEEITSRLNDVFDAGGSEVTMRAGSADDDLEWDFDLVEMTQSTYRGLRRVMWRRIRRITWQPSAWEDGAMSM
jgi:hypothetical protein